MTHDELMKHKARLAKAAENEEMERAQKRRNNGMDKEKMEGLGLKWSRLRRGYAELGGRGGKKDNK